MQISRTLVSSSGCGQWAGAGTPSGRRQPGGPLGKPTGSRTAPPDPPEESKAWLCHAGCLAWKVRVLAGAPSPLYTVASTTWQLCCPDPEREGPLGADLAQIWKWCCSYTRGEAVRCPLREGRNGLRGWSEGTMAGSWFGRRGSGWRKARFCSPRCSRLNRRPGRDHLVGVSTPCRAAHPAAQYDASGGLGGQGVAPCHRGGEAWWLEVMASSGTPHCSPLHAVGIVQTPPDSPIPSSMHPSRTHALMPPTGPPATQVLAVPPRCPVQ